MPVLLVAVGCIVAQVRACADWVVSCRYNLLCELAALQPGWSEQLDNATSETLAVWLCSRWVWSSAPSQLCQVSATSSIAGPVQVSSLRWQQRSSAGTQQLANKAQ